MTREEKLELLNALKDFVKPHPWHGIRLRASGAEASEVNVYVEIVPTDTVKYELDKESGHLKIDRPQKFSNILPALYGFIPQTYCGKETARFSEEKTGLKLEGDKDPLDICVLTESHIPHGDVLVNAKIIGGYRMIDKGEADDKILAVLKDDALYGAINDISELPKRVVERLRHYFLTYKGGPIEEGRVNVDIQEVYGKETALKVVELSSRDYDQEIAK